MSYVPPHLRRHQHSSTGATSHGKKSKRDNRGGSDDGSSGSSHRRGNTTDGRNNRREYNNDDKSSSADNTDELNPNISSSRGSDGRGGSFGGIPPSPLSTSHCHDHDYAPSRSRRAFQDRRTRRRPDIGNTVHRDAALAVRNSQAKRDARRNRFRAAGEVGTATSLSLPSSSLSSPPLPSSLLLSKSRAGVYGTCTSLCVREELSKRKLRQLEQSWTDTPSHTDATKTKDESNTDTKNIDRTADNESDGDNCDNDKRNQRSGEGYSHSDTAHRHHHSQQKRFELHKSCLLHYCPHTHLSPAPTATAIGDVSSIVALKEYQRSSASKLKVHAIRDDPLSTIRPPRVRKACIFVPYLYMHECMPTLWLASEYARVIVSLYTCVRFYFWMKELEFTPSHRSCVHQSAYSSHWCTQCAIWRTGFAVGDGSPATVRDGAV